MNKAKKLDQWFTKDNVATYCCKIMVENNHINKCSTVIEPSAGRGAFIEALAKYMPKDNIIAFDIDPQIEGIKYMDWLGPSNTLNYNANNVIIGNPPYGKKAKLAVAFINKALDIADIVGFIVPLTLSASWHSQKNVREDAELIYEKKLPKSSFEFEGKPVDVPSVFQIWRRKETDLRLKKPKTEHPDLEIRIYNKTETAKKWLDWNWDIAIKRNSKKGEYICKGETATDDYHWILVKGDIDILTKIDWSKLNDNKMTAGIGKADVIKAYMEAVNDN